MAELASLEKVAAKAAQVAVPEQYRKKDAEPIVKTSEFYTGVLSKGSANVMGQCTRKEYINEFIGFWKDDYRAKAKCVALLAAAGLTFNVFLPYSLFMVALAAKYWDHASWCRNIARFNGWFRTIVLVN